MCVEGVKWKNFEILMIVNLNLCIGSLDLRILIIPTHTSMVALFLNIFMGLCYLLNSLNLWFLLCRMEAVIALNFRRFL